MMFLLDTMVMSETGKRAPNPAVMDWLGRAAPEGLYVCVVTFGEIAAGIERKRLSDPMFSDRLDLWSVETRRAYLDRTLPITTEIALRWGRLMAEMQRGDTDLLIAATALTHDLTIVTRNTRHFSSTGVKILNPYET